MTDEQREKLIQEIMRNAVLCKKGIWTREMAEKHLRDYYREPPK